MYETLSSLPPAGTAMAKLPSMSVTTAASVPATRTVAPITGSPSSAETTFPLNCDWASAVLAASSWLAKSIFSLLFI